MAGISSAPCFEIAPRDVVAVEHPMIAKNIDNALKTFGVGDPFEKILDCASDPLGVVPLYLRYNDPFCVPIFSRNSATKNVLLQITVPKRTGRKRKRGSQDLYSGEVAGSEENGDVATSEADGIRSQSRRDNPLELLRTLKDNVGRYSVEAVAEIQQTHRFRGQADFHQSTTNSQFMSELKNKVYPGTDLDELRKFKFRNDRGYKINEEIMPPPRFTIHPLPFNWGWHQSINVVESTDKTTGERVMLNNASRHRYQISYIPYDVDCVPQGPDLDEPNQPELQEMIGLLKEAFNERPLWTRRALINRFGDSPVLYFIKSALQYTSFQFKGGPFREALCKYGVDPRTDPKYRIYQTLFFKLYQEKEQGPFMQWREPRRADGIARNTRKINQTTHIFDGRALTLDGKVWQVCDITDPLLADIIQNAPLRQTFDLRRDGWFCDGVWAKIRAIMKMKLYAIATHKIPTDEDYEPALKFPDVIKEGPSDKGVYIPGLPDMRLSDIEVQRRKEKGEDPADFVVGKLGKDKSYRMQRIRQQKEGGPGGVTTIPMGKRRRQPVMPSEGSSSGLIPSIETDDGVAGEMAGDLDDMDLDEDSGLDEDSDAEDRTDVEDESQSDGVGEEGSDDVQEEEEEDEDSDATDFVDFRKYYKPQHVAK